MKKRFWLTICLLLIIPTFVFAANEKNLKTRTSLNNYGVSKKWDMSSSTRINHALSTPYVDASEKIYDYSNILSTTDKDELKLKMDKFIKKTGFDMVFVSVDLIYNVDSTNENYAADFYDYNDFGLNDEYYSGVLLLRNTYESNPYFNIYTFGEAQLYFTYERLENILDDIYPYFKDGVDYLGGINKFIDELNSYYDKGKPLSSRNDTLDEYGNVVKGYNPPYLVAFIGAIAVSAIVVSIEVHKNKMVKKATTAFDYLDKNSINYTKKDDRYIRSHTSSYKTSSSSGSGGGGHSIGSSGGGHSSGGGRHG